MALVWVVAWAGMWATVKGGEWWEVRTAAVWVERWDVGSGQVWAARSEGPSGAETGKVWSGQVRGAAWAHSSGAGWEGLSVRELAGPWATLWAVAWEESSAQAWAGLSGVEMDEVWSGPVRAVAWAHSLGAGWEGWSVRKLAERKATLWAAALGFLMGLDSAS
jgi:hypothetical protein